MNNFLEGLTGESRSDQHKTTKNNSPVSTIIFFLGLILLICCVIIYAKDTTNILALLGMGVGLIFVIIRFYSMNYITLGVPYFIASLFGLMGIVFVFFLHENVLDFPPVVPIYLSLAFFSCIFSYHKDKIYYGRKNATLHKIGYVSSLDAIIIIASLLILYSGFTHINNIDLLTLTNSWYEGYYASISFLLFALKKRDEVYIGKLWNKVMIVTLVLVGGFLAVFPLVKFILSNDTNNILSLLFALFNCLLGIIIIYFTITEEKE